MPTGVAVLHSSSKVFELILYSFFFLGWGGGGIYLFLCPWGTEVGGWSMDFDLSSMLILSDIMIFEASYEKLFLLGIMGQAW